MTFVLQLDLPLPIILQGLSEGGIREATQHPPPTTLSIHPESLISCRGRGFNALCVMYNFLAAYDTVYWC